MELNYWEKQLILYTKNHFEKIDYDGELRYFPSKLYGLYLEHTEDYNVFGMVVRLYQRLVDMELLTFSLEGFLNDAFRRSLIERGKNDELNRRDIMRLMLAAIQNMNVMGTHLDLGVRDDELFKTLQVARTGENVKS